MSQKRADFELLKLAAELITNKLHLTQKGLEKIVAIKASMNLGLSNELKQGFSAYPITAINRPSVDIPIIKDPNWLAGFINGDGNFLIDCYNSKTNKLGIAVRLKVRITQHVRDILLMESITRFLGCGKVSTWSTNPSAVYFVEARFDNIVDKIIPLLKKYPIYGVKALDFSDFCKASKIILNKEHLTLQGLDKIKNLKNGMNTGRI